MLSLLLFLHHVDVDEVADPIIRLPIAKVCKGDFFLEQQLPQIGDAYGVDTGPRSNRIEEKVKPEMGIVGQSGQRFVTDLVVIGIGRPKPG